jgi:hypothetical protein
MAMPECSTWDRARALLHLEFLDSSMDHRGEFLLRALRPRIILQFGFKTSKDVRNV